MCENEEDKDTVAEAVVIKFVLDLLGHEAVEGGKMVAKQGKFEGIFGLLKQQQKIPHAELRKRQLELPSPCTLLRAISSETGVVVVPSNPIAAWYIKHGDNAAEALRLAVKEAQRSDADKAVQLK
jgi:hypothetical protein